MTYLSANSRTTKPTRNDQLQGLGRQTSLFGVFVGFVKRADDVQKNGRLLVWIPELGSPPDDEQGWITVSYCSPFAGATNVNSTNKSNVEDFNGTQTSYGMWMIPPDIDNQVIVMFVAGDSARGIWIGSMYNQFANNMVPAVAADTNNYQYPGKAVPVAEYNKWDKTVNQPDMARRPYNKTKFDGISNQGLINDKIRGVSNTSARRESPSSVYGILTPGPVIDKTASPSNIRRKGGSSLIMDDGECSEYVEWSTKSGAKIRIDETYGLIYLVNRDGTAWVQLDAEGNVDIFSAKNISLRSQRDFNIRADRNINIEAGQNIFMKAAKDTKETTTSFTYDVNNHPSKKTIPVWNYVGEGAGDGGNIVMQALWNTHTTAKNNAFLTVTENHLDIRVGTNFKVTTEKGGQDFNSKMGIKLSTESAIDIGSKGNLRIGANGSISITSDGPNAICSSDTIGITSTGNMSIVSASGMSLDAEQINADTNLIINNIDADNITSKNVDAGSVNSRTRTYNRSPIGSGSPASPSTPSTTINGPGESVLSAAVARIAETKPLNQKINVLADWENNDSKFIRKSAPVLTTTSRYPTYEPCPEHFNFAPASVTNTSPILTPADLTYAGSAGAGNTQTAIPESSTDPRVLNKSIPADSLSGISSSDFNYSAFMCQIKKHEGVVYSTYKDRDGLSAGVGHLLRENEIIEYPLGSPISESQVNLWLETDTQIAINIANTIFKDCWNSLSDVRKRALVDLSFNLGQPRLSKFTNFIKSMKSGDYERAAADLKDSLWYSQVGVRGRNIVTMISQSIDPLNCG